MPKHHLLKNIPVKMYLSRHMLQCPQLAHRCSLADLIMFNGVEKQGAEPWKKMVL